VKQTGLRTTRITLVLDERLNFGTESAFTPKVASDSAVNNMLWAHPVANEIRILAGLKPSVIRDPIATPAS